MATSTSILELGMLFSLLAALLAVVVVVLIRSSLRPAKFPPGPRNLPIIGSLLWLDVRNLSRSLARLARRHGNIFSIYVGNTPVVVLNDYSTIKSAFERMEFSGRPGNFSGTFFQRGKTGVTTTEGRHWQTQRQFLQDHLDSLTGPASQALEEVVDDEVSELKQWLGRRQGEAIAPGYRLNIGILNVLWTVTCGRKLHPQQQEFQAVYECVDKITQFMSRAAIFSFLPVLTKLLPESVTSIERGRYHRDRFHEISEKWIREHRQDYRGNRTGDLQDAYIARLDKGEETFTTEGLAALLREIFVIGSESESVLLRWAVRLLACHPSVQRRVQTEVDTVAGRGGQVRWDMRDQLPFTRATLLEIHRFADIAPTGLLHKTVCDASVAGFELPAGTLVLPHLAACHTDPALWEKPDAFYPEHFLQDGRLVEDKPGFLPYGVGRRACPGRNLAEMQVFLTVTSLLSEYSIALPTGDSGTTGTQFQSGTAVLRNPKPYRVVVNKRE